MMFYVFEWSGEGRYAADRDANLEKHISRQQTYLSFVEDSSGIVLQFEGWQRSDTGGILDFRIFRKLSCPLHHRQAITPLLVFYKQFCNFVSNSETSLIYQILSNQMTIAPQI